MANAARFGGLTLKNGVGGVLFMMIYKTVLLKLSGEAFSGSLGRGIDRGVLCGIVGELKPLLEEGLRLGVVIGGGNFWRGRDAEGFDRASADAIGMMATVMNALALQEVFISRGIEAEVMSAVDVPRFAPAISILGARRFLDSGKVVIFSGGTGAPFVSTDTAAAMRALEIKADALLKATLVDGVYDKDPNKYPDAVKYDSISYLKVIEDNLKVMDLPAISLCRDNSLTVRIFNMTKKGTVSAVLHGAAEGTIVKE